MRLYTLSQLSTIFTLSERAAHDADDSLLQQVHSLHAGLAVIIQTEKQCKHLTSNDGGTAS